MTAYPPLVGRPGLASILLAALLAGCGSAPPKPLALARDVDLQRLAGDWYVIANIPTFIEVGAHNAVESYRLLPDGRIGTTFTFRAGGFDGEARRYEARGRVLDRASNAVWGMQFVWPFEADFRIAWVDPDYREIVVAREKRDHVWIMARSPRLAEADYRRLLAFVAAQGYDASRVQKVPQQWPR